MTRVASASALLQRGMRIFRTCWLACLIVGVCLVILIGSVLGWVTYRQQQTYMEAQFQRRAIQHARGINPEKVGALSGSLEDIGAPVYQRIKRHLKIIRQAETNCRFTYLMRQLDDGTVIILADSEPPESDDYSPPGDVYYEAGEDEEALFAHGQPRVFPPEADRWGKWVSVYAPIRDPYTAEVIALFGMDVDVADWQAALYRQLLPAFVSALLLLVGVAIFCWALRSQERGGNRLANMLVRYGEFIAIGCFGLLLTGYTAWLRHGHEGHRIMTSFAQIADRDLSRVQQRLEHVRDFSLQDLDWYVSNQSEFDRQQFNDWVTARLERPSLHSWGWVGVVPDSHRQDFEDSHAGILPPIWELDADGLPRPATRRPVHYPLMAAKPFELIGEALGYDLGSEPRRRAAIEEAIFTRLTTASQPVDLAIKAPEREALLILHPVFSAADSDDLLGLIVTPLAVPNLVRQVWEGQSSHYSFSSVSEDTPPILLYNTCPRAEHPLDDIGLVRYIGIFGQVLKLETHPGPLFYESHRRYAASRTLFIGFITTAALAKLVGAPLHQRRLLEVLVNERTTELQNSQQQYDMLIAHSRAFRWEVDHTGLYTYVSDNVAEIIGFTPQDLVGKKTFYDLAPLEYREEVKQHGDGNACIKVDPTQLDQVLVNLCVNARDAIDGHGAIVLTTWETVLTGDERLAGEQPNPGDYVVLSVRDTGCGMDPDLLEKIFEPFFTTKPRGKGTGLGLSTVYGIVKQNGGYMEVSSAPGTGTKFNLYFPSCEQADVEVRDDPEQIPVRYDAGILVVDDEVDILRIAERTLSKRGYRVWIADSPRRALEIIQGCGEKIDLLLTDIVMPEMNGRELAEKAIALNPMVAYLFISGYSDEIMTQDEMNSRETKVLSKPFTANELLAAVIAALQRV